MSSRIVISHFRVKANALFPQKLTFGLFNSVSYYGSYLFVYLRDDNIAKRPYICPMVILPKGGSSSCRFSTAQRIDIWSQLSKGDILLSRRGSSGACRTGEHEIRLQVENLSRQSAVHGYCISTPFRTLKGGRRLHSGLLC